MFDPISSKVTEAGVIYLLYSALIVIAFLTVLNGYLNGSKKHHIDAVLSVLLIACLVGAFVLSGWKSGLFAIALSFIAAVTTRPVAFRIAHRLRAWSGPSSHRIGF